MACSPRAELWGARTHWAVRSLARAAAQWSFVRRISKSTVHQWLKDADLKPHRVRRWLHSPDPEFRAKVRKIVRLYLHPPRGTRVICADEKTQLQVLEHIHPARPMRPGLPMRVEQTYRRHGVVAVLAGLDVRTGRVSLLVRPRRRHQEFLELLERLRRRWPKERLLIVVDNLSIHTHPRVTAWVQPHQGRVQLVFLPLHASWLKSDRALVQRPRAAMPQAGQPQDTGRDGRTHLPLRPPLESYRPTLSLDFQRLPPTPVGGYRIYWTLH
jgi:hypothetical protein